MCISEFKWSETLIKNKLKEEEKNKKLNLRKGKTFYK